MRYSKDIQDKLLVKFLHDELGLPIPFIAYLTGVTRSTCHFRYRTACNEVENYEDTREKYQKMLDRMNTCSWDGVFKFKIK